MSKRKAIPVKVQVSVAIRQAGGVRCPLCLGWVDGDEPRVLEHMTPHATMVALGKVPDAIDNLRWVHAECAAKKTNGTKATCADGDLHKIAKAKRVAKATEIHRAVVARVMERKPSRIRSRGFDKTLTKKFNGRVERRT